MNVLVCNDDGINSEGIIALALVLLKNGHNVTVVAPESNRSGFAHSTTFYREVAIKKVQFSEGIEAYSLSGTPADCAKYGITQLGKKFDLVLGGINNGSNLGTEVLYSGTVAIGTEANCLGYKSMAFSCLNYKQANMKWVAEVCYQIIEKFYATLSPEFTLNVNVPPLTENESPLGVKITPLGVSMYTDVYEFVREGVFMLTGDPIDWDNPEDCDVELIKKKFVTITPILCDRTAYSVLEKLKGN